MCIRDRAAACKFALVVAFRIVLLVGMVSDGLCACGLYDADGCDGAAGCKFAFVVAFRIGLPVGMVSDGLCAPVDCTMMMVVLGLQCVSLPLWMLLG